MTDLAPDSATTTTAELLVDLMVDALLAAATDAGDGVQAYRDWGINTNSGVFTPKITIDLPREEKAGLGDVGPATFDTTALITLRAFVSAAAAAAPGGDGGEVRVRQAVMRLRRQIEVAIINAPSIMAAISKISRVRTQMQASTESNGLHIVEVAMEFAFVFYQGPEAFAQPELDDVDDLWIELKLGSPAGVDVIVDVSLDLAAQGSILDFSDPANSGLLAAI